MTPPPARCHAAVGYTSDLTGDRLRALVDAQAEIRGRLADGDPGCGLWHHTDIDWGDLPATVQVADPWAGDRLLLAWQCRSPAHCYGPSPDPTDLHPERLLPLHRRILASLTGTADDTDRLVIAYVRAAVTFGGAAGRKHIGSEVTALLDHAARTAGDLTVDLTCSSRAPGTGVVAAMWRHVTAGDLHAAAVTWVESTAPAPFGLSPVERRTWNAAVHHAAPTALRRAARIARAVTAHATTEGE